MIKDRGTKKWVALMLPEHVAAVKEELLNEKKVKKPKLDQEKLNDIDLLIHEGMEYHFFLQFSLFKNGFIEILIGRTVFIDYIKRELRIEEETNTIHYIPFHLLIDVERL
ncbi:YolD-like family protein [Niallia alba]|uniref:YolD-like family protein n=1 Tax=Niallia alba TaxID=2729105 RepID=UPI002904E3FC|nr:YolD-like family protein [Niallia nealsonii]